MLPQRRLLPWWLVFLVCVPLQVWLFFQLRASWGIWPTVGTILVVSLVAAKAARPQGLLSWIFPNRAARKNATRPFWLLVLAAAAAATWFLPWGPQPWLAAFIGASGAKAVVG